MDSKLPKNWEIVNVSEFVSLLEIGGRPRGGAGKLTEGIPSISAEHFNYGGGFKFEKLKFITEEFYEKLNKGKIKNGDVLVVKDGATTGKSAYIDNKFPFDKAAVNEHTFIIRTYEGFENKLLFYFTLSSDFNNYILNTIGGSTIGGIKKGFINELRFNLPPLAEQQRIVAKLDTLFGSLDALKIRLNNIPQLIKNFKQAVLTQAVTGKLTQEWRVGKELEEWENLKIEDVIKSLNQGWSPKCESFPSKGDKIWGVIKTSAVQPLKFIEGENKQLPVHLEPRKQHELITGDLLITRAGPRVRVGIASLVKKVRPKLMICDKVYRLRVDKKIIKSEFLEIILNSPQILAIIEIMKTGISDSGLNLTQTKFKSIKFNLPPKEEQTEIVKRVENLFSKADAIEKQYKTLKEKIDRLPQAILAKAFKGELVAQLPTDGDAKDLLEEIKKLKESLVVKPKKKVVRNKK
ncbi:restriction endonuclease subunit S [Tenacibaculum finnmarkense genomovar ulcerans]|uniref:restriction endonuclease subunit S n=1 Tax=Tenacibaculum finnmarkense TaxID=2781243 RepID=UPI001E342175|nr:restriction endonuclease subunit S [Tenacibaculum finnmarkense]MCD8432347.1 restriction endonuclease subunit S [Tenacibaculum finnmarkense genomovar ulcerans]